MVLLWRAWCCCDDAMRLRWRAWCCYGRCVVVRRLGSVMRESEAVAHATQRPMRRIKSDLGLGTVASRRVVTLPREKKGSGSRSAQG
jgi:hypothetical protein